MKASTLRTQLLGLAFWLFTGFATAGIGALGSADSPELYRSLDRPSWAPPAWLFGPVWTVLYVLIGISAWLVWRERGAAKARIELIVFLIQLALNALWTWLFFAWRQGGLAFGEILLLGVMIVVNIVLFWRIRPLAGAILLPYLLWVAFASMLTFSIWRRNLDVL